MRLITDTREAQAMEALKSVRDHSNYEQLSKFGLTERFYAVEPNDMSELGANPLIPELHGGLDGPRVTPLVWRGDDRHPVIARRGVPPVFSTGFASKALRSRGDVLRVGIEVEAGGIELYRNEAIHVSGENFSPVYRAQVGDMYLPRSVSITWDPRIAGYFPTDDAGTPIPGESFLYGIQLRSYFNLHKVQAQIGPERLIYAREIASVAVPSVHIVGAIQIAREVGASTTEFSVSTVFWNPGYAGAEELKQLFRQMYDALALFNEIKVPSPKPASTRTAPTSHALQSAVDGARHDRSSPTHSEILKDILGDRWYQPRESSVTGGSVLG